MPWCVFGADVVACLFSSNSKVRFRAKIKIILKKLCRKFGYDTVLRLAPETDRKLITHIQKQAARGERIAARDGQQAKGRDPQFDDLMGWTDDHSGAEDSDDGDDDDDVMDFGDDDDEEDEDGNIARRMPGGKTGEAGIHGVMVVMRRAFLSLLLPTYRPCSADRVLVRGQWRSRRSSSRPRGSVAWRARVCMCVRAGMAWWTCWMSP